MLKPENQVDKKRFQTKRAVKKNHGEPDRQATQDAAAEVKQERENEGRSKSEGDPIESNVPRELEAEEKMGQRRENGANESIDRASSE